MRLANGGGTRVESSQNIPNPFGGVGELTACVEGLLTFEQLAAYYRASADTLVESAAYSHASLDVHVYAICYLYRHSLELLLKAIHWQTQYAATGLKQPRNGHGLSSLWGETLKLSRELLKDDFPLTHKEQLAIKSLLAGFEEYDQASDAFRYPYDKRKNRPLRNLFRVCLNDLNAAVFETSSSLYRIQGLVEYYYEQRSEIERSL